MRFDQDLPAAVFLAKLCMRLYLLGGPWVVVSRVIPRVTILITHIRGLITPLITTLNPETLNPKSLQNPLKGPLKGTPLITTLNPALLNP